MGRGDDEAAVSRHHGVCDLVVRSATNSFVECKVSAPAGRAKCGRGTAGRRRPRTTWRAGDGATAARAGHPCL